MTLTYTGYCGCNGEGLPSLASTIRNRDCGANAMLMTREQYRDRLKALERNKRGRERITEAYGRLFFSKDHVFLSPPKMHVMIDALLNAKFPKQQKAKRR